MQDFLSIAVVGSALALAIQFIKGKYGLDSIKTKAITLALSVILGGVFYFLAQTSWWQTILGVLAASSTFWAFFLKEDKQ